MRCLWVFIKIGTMKSSVKLDVKGRISRVRDFGTSLVNEINHATLVDEEIVVTHEIGESTVF